MRHVLFWLGVLVAAVAIFIARDTAIVQQGVPALLKVAVVLAFLHGAVFVYNRLKARQRPTSDPPA